MTSENRRPKVGELWRTTGRLLIYGRVVPKGTVALVVESGHVNPSYPSVLDMSILIDGSVHSVYSGQSDWELVSDA